MDELVCLACDFALGVALAFTAVIGQLEMSFFPIGSFLLRKFSLFFHPLCLIDLTPTFKEMVSR